MNITAQQSVTPQQKEAVCTHINDGPLLHYDGIVRWGGCIRLTLTCLLEDEDTFHWLRQQICREEGKKIHPWKGYLLDGACLSCLSFSFRPPRLQEMEYDSATFTHNLLLHSQWCWAICMSNVHLYIMQGDSVKERSRFAPAGILKKKRHYVLHKWFSEARAVLVFMLDS